MNSWFSNGYRLPVTEEYFYWTLNSVEVKHYDGYISVHATPDFSTIDLMALTKEFLGNIDLTLTEVF